MLLKQRSIDSYMIDVDAKLGQVQNTPESHTPDPHLSARLHTEKCDPSDASLFL